MKKFLLSLAAVAMVASSALAETVTFNMATTFGTSTISGISEKKFTSGNVTFTFNPDKGTGSNAPAFNKAGDVRLYANNTLTVSSTDCTIERISFVLSKQGKTQYAKITASNGTIENQASGDTEVIWSGNSDNITFTVGAKNDYGTSATKTAGQLCFTDVTIEYTANGDTPKEPIAYEPNFQDITLSVGETYNLTLGDKHPSDIIFVSDNDAIATVTNEGVITGTGVGTTSITCSWTADENFLAPEQDITFNVTVKKAANLSFTAESYTGIFGEEAILPTLENPNNLAVTYSSSNESVATVTADGTVSLVGVGTTTITATSAETEEYKAGKASYTLTLTAPIVPLTLPYESAMGEDFTYENVEGETYPWQFDSKYGLKGGAYIDGKVIKCEGYAVSPVINLTGKKDITLTFDQAFNNYKLNGALIDVADFKDYAYIVVREVGTTEWVEVAQATAPASFSWTFFANGPVSLNAYMGKMIQVAFKYVSSDTVAGTWEVKKIEITGIDDQESAVESVETDANAPVEYYNLQGVRVANPEKGLYIVRQGGKASKVVL